MPLFMLLWIFFFSQAAHGHYVKQRSVLAEVKTESYAFLLSHTGRAINEPCDINNQCNGTIGAICSSHGFCECPFKGIVSEELGKPRCFLPVRTLYDICEVDEQCRRAILNSHCSSAGVCTCYHGYMYFWSSGTCAMPPGPDTTKAQEVYKTAMAAAACTLIALVGIFVGCVVKKTFCSGSHHNTSRHPLGRLTSLTESISSVNAALDKPPSYDEIMTSLTCVTPPPDYRDLHTIFGLRDPRYFVFPQNLTQLANSSVLQAASPIPSPTNSPNQIFEFKLRQPLEAVQREEAIPLSDMKSNNDKATSTNDKDLAPLSEVFPSKESIEKVPENISHKDSVENTVDQQSAEDKIDPNLKDVPSSLDDAGPSSLPSNDDLSTSVCIPKEPSSSNANNQSTSDQ